VAAVVAAAVVAAEEEAEAVALAVAVAVAEEESEGAEVREAAVVEEEAVAVDWKRREELPADRSRRPGPIAPTSWQSCLRWIPLSAGRTRRLLRRHPSVDPASRPRRARPSARAA
jgi:hypothetical protein